MLFIGDLPINAMVIFQFAKCKRLPEGRVREFAVQDAASTIQRPGIDPKRDLEFHHEKWEI